MADTKKEHYVPRCYLSNFENENKKINVFDKYKLQRREQRIMDVAMENYFYDTDLMNIYNSANDTEQEKMKYDLLKIMKTDKWEDVLNLLNDKKHIESVFFSNLEGVYSELLKRIIAKSYNGNQWVMNNCYAMSKEEKSMLSLFIAIQIVRTKSFRDTLGDTIEKMYQVLAYKAQMKDVNALPKEAFEVSVDKDYVKLQHNGMVLNEEMAIDFAEVIENHIWVMYYNKTKRPFYTSDNPVARIPHKFDKYMSYGGLNSEGIEIVFPITPNLLVGMYDEKIYNKIFTDRDFIVLTREEQIDYFNYAQVISSQRCIFSSKDNFALAEKLCIENPKLQEYHSNIEVG